MRSPISCICLPLNFQYSYYLVTREALKDVPRVKAFNAFIIDRSAKMKHVFEGGSARAVETQRSLLVELQPRLAEPDRVRRRDRNGAVDAEDGDLEFVARFDGIGEHHAIGQVEPLNGRWAGIAALAAVSVR
jgi:hypothetical protein